MKRISGARRPLAPSLVAAVAVAAAVAPFSARADAPGAAARVVHAPAAARVRVVTLSELADEPAGGAETSAPRLVPNVFPAPGELGEIGPTTGEPGAPPDPARAREGAIDVPIPSIDRRFDGPFDGGLAPPDPVMAVGSTHVVALINSRIAVYDKSGNLVDGPTSLRAFFGIPSGFSAFDPLAIHDPFTDRFIVTTLSDNGGTADSRIYIAFSQTADASGAWNTYFIDADRDQEPNWADYASIGVDRLAVYLTANMFSRSNVLQNVTLFVYDKSDGYAGDPLDNSHLIDVTTASGGAPFRLRPAAVREPVPGDEYYLLHSASGFTASLNLFRLTGDRFTAPVLAASSVPLGDFAFGPGPARQPGGAPGVDTLGMSLWNVFYRAGTLWAAQAVVGSASIEAWIHTLDVTSDPAVRTRTLVLSETDRDIYFPHVVPDAEDDDVAVAAAYSGPDRHVTGKYWNLAADGTLRGSELMVDSARRNDSGRHGDYFAIGVDPTDRDRIWMTAQYMKSSSIAGQQIIASVLFEDAPPPASPPPVPDGASVAGEPVRVARAVGDELTVTWDALACPPAGNHLVWLDLAAIATYTVAAETCDIGTGGSWTGPAPAPGSLGILVVSDDGAGTEGSHGSRSDGSERGSASAVCAQVKDPAGTCP